MRSRFSGDDVLVTVVIPTRDCLGYLPGCLDSVLMQQEKRFEILVLDDGSTDGTWPWLQVRTEAYPRLRAVRLAGDGVYPARNVAIGLARGRFIAFLDADDRWRPEKLARQLAFHLARPDIVFSFADYEHVDVGGRSLGCCFAFWPHFARFASSPGFTSLAAPEAAALIFRENVVGTSSVMARTDALQNANGFDSGLHSAADWELWLRLALTGPVGFTTDVLVDYLVRPGAISRNVELRLRCMAEIIDRHRDAIAAVDPAAVRGACARLWLGEAERARGEKRPLAACRLHLRAALRLRSGRYARAAAADLRTALLGGADMVDPSRA